MKTYTKEDIKQLLSENDHAVMRAVVAIWQYQTSHEKLHMHTNEHNLVGFSAFDANILSSFAEQIGRGRSLSIKQLAVARRRMMKYVGQLARIANEKAAMKAGLPATTTTPDMAVA